MIIKKWDGSAWVAQSAKVNFTDIVADVTAATPVSIFEGGKIKDSYLPSYIFGGMRFAGSISAQSLGQDFELVYLLYTEWGWLVNSSSDPSNNVGSYFISLDGGQLPGSSTADANGFKYIFENSYNETSSDVEDYDSTTLVELETGDWLVFTRYDSVTKTLYFSVVNNTYQKATQSASGIVKLGSGTLQTVAANTVTAIASRTYATQVNSSGQLVVNVPWTDTNTTYSQATTSTLGLVKLGVAAADVTVNGAGSTAGRYYPVGVKTTGEMYVNVPWSDTNTTYSEATSSTLGLVKIGYSENGKNYPVELSNGQMFVNVPWTDTDTNTTYTAGVGLTLTSTEFKMENPIEIGTATPASGYQIQNGALWFDLN